MGRFKFEWKSVNCDGRSGLALLGFCAVLLLVSSFGHIPFMALRYERTAIASGEWWRLLTAHVVHLSFLHALLNTVGLCLMWALFAREYSPWRWMAIVLVAIAAIDTGLWFRDEEIAWYVGTSGALHGVMAAGTLARLRRGDRTAWILAVFLIAKLSYEQLAGAMPFSAPTGPVIVNAHLYGAIGGVLAAALLGSARVRL